MKRAFITVISLLLLSSCGDVSSNSSSSSGTVQKGSETSSVTDTESTASAATETIESVAEKEPASNSSDEPQIADAEKYAQIVLDNESVWHDPWEKKAANSYLSVTSLAWFQDLDFDGTPEFVVGTMNIPAQATAYGFDVFRFTDDGKMKKLTSDTPFEDYSISFTPHFRGVFEGMNGYVYKNGAGEYIYVCDEVNNSVASHGCNVIQCRFGKEKIETQTLCDYLYQDLPDFHEEFYEYLGSKTDKDKFEKTIKR